MIKNISVVEVSVGICILLLSLLSMQAYADSGYSVIPLDPSQDYNSSTTDTSGADKTITFLELPLWIQIDHIAGSLYMFILYNLLPLLSGRMEDLLDNKNRKSIFNYIVRNPGCTNHEISRKQHMNIGTVRYHIQRLESEGKIVIQRMGKFMRIFKNNSTYSDMEKVIASYIRNETSRNILRVIMENPGMTSTEISRELGIDKSRAHRYIRAFVDAHIILPEQDGNQKRYYVSDDAMIAIGKLMPPHQYAGMVME